MMTEDFKESFPLRAEDETLIRRLNRGDKEAFTSLYEQNVDGVYRFLSHLLKDEELAEDLTQFTFMQIWIHRKEISYRKNLTAYLYVIARNAAYKEFRKQVVAETYADTVIKEDENCERENYGRVDFKAISQEIRRCIEGLPESRRQIYMMSRFEGLKSSEIAERLGISVSTVDVQLSRARATLRKNISRMLVAFLFLS